MLALVRGKEVRKRLHIVVEDDEEITLGETND
jgi:hypothetical protein